MAIGAKGLGFDSLVGQIEHGRQQLATAATFFRSSVAQAQDRGYHSRHSLLALT